MKKGSIISALIGGAFFAIPYLAMDIAFLPSAVIAVAAFGAGNLVFTEQSEEVKQVIKPGSLYDVLTEAKKQNAQIYAMMNRVDDAELRRTIGEIFDTSAKIIDTVSRKPEKQNMANNFFNYYLPSTLNFLKKYDEIENQRLITKESKDFMDSAEEMMKKINRSFKVQLANLYKSDIIGTDAEMKVFDTMLKTDGIEEKSDFDIK